MQYRNLGNSGLRVSRVGVGNWLTFGQRVEQEVANECLRRAFDGGVIFFDTADVYGQGAGEVAMGKALADFRRSDYVLATKAFWPMSGNPNDCGLSRKHLLESIDASLQRLGTDYVDLYQCHRDDPDTPLEEICRAMDHIIGQGKALYWGVSCWRAERISDAVSICDRLGLARPISNQPPYNMFERGVEDAVLPMCEANGLGQVVFSPLAQGVLTGKYRGGVPDGARASDAEMRKFMEKYLTEGHAAVVERLVEVAKDTGCTLTELSLAWVTRSKSVASAIVGVTRVEHVDSNISAGDIDLSGETLDRIEAILADVPHRLYEMF